MSKIKNHFTSRWENGVIINADFKQLEVIAFAFLSQDAQLIKDIIDGVDIHRRNASDIYHISQEEVSLAQRQTVKMATFAIIYGAGRNRLASDLKITDEFAQEIINTFFNRYPIAKQWQIDLVEQVKANKVPIEEKTKNGYPIELGYYQNVTGRMLFFKTNDSPDFLQKKGIMTGFNPPSIKDYPVQSFATSDLIMVFLGVLFRESIKNREKWLLINTVHDSVIFDCKKEFSNQCCKMLEDSIQLTIDRMKMYFGFDFNVPINIDITQGYSWGEC